MNLDLECLNCGEDDQDLLVTFEEEDVLCDPDYPEEGTEDRYYLLCKDCTEKHDAGEDVEYLNEPNWAC